MTLHHQQSHSTPAVAPTQDYEYFVAKHRECAADITVGAVPMDEARAAAFGLMKIDDTGKIIDFAEKPEGDELKAMAVDTTILGLDAERAKDMPYIASMGIYIFNKTVRLRFLHTHAFPTIAPALATPLRCFLDTLSGLGRGEDRLDDRQEERPRFLPNRLYLKQNKLRGTLCACRLRSGKARSQRPASTCGTEQIDVPPNFSGDGEAAAGGLPAGERLRVGGDPGR
jgi:hypothetical protein